MAIAEGLQLNVGLRIPVCATLGADASDGEPDRRPRPQQQRGPNQVAPADSNELAHVTPGVERSIESARAVVR